MTADLVVIGGGPLGLATALYADRAGLSVRVLEPRAGVADPRKLAALGLLTAAVLGALLDGRRRSWQGLGPQRPG